MNEMVKGAVALTQRRNENFVFTGSTYNLLRNLHTVSEVMEKELKQCYSEIEDKEKDVVKYWKSRDYYKRKYEELKKRK